MKAFRADGVRFTAKLEEVEVALLTSLVEQLCDLLGDGPDADSDDPLARWASDAAAARRLDRGDPVIQRLFPDAYADDRVAAEEFHRYTADEQRRGRLAAAHLVLADLAATHAGRRPVTVASGHVDAWLKTVNSVRLSLAVRLGIEAEDDHEELERLHADDPRAYVLELYDWLGFVLESLLEAVHDTA